MRFALITATALLLGIGPAAAATDHPNFHKGNPPGFNHGNKTGWGSHQAGTWIEARNKAGTENVHQVSKPRKATTTEINTRFGYPHWEGG